MPQTSLMLGLMRRGQLAVISAIHSSNVASRSKRSIKRATWYRPHLGHFVQSGSSTSSRAAMSRNVVAPPLKRMTHVSESIPTTGMRGRGAASAVSSI
jgi:hypothetical protein